VIVFSFMFCFKSNNNIFQIDKELITVYIFK